MRAKRVLIVGAGIAGPALALALSLGEGPPPEVVVVEKAAQLREGGQAVDFRGPVHREVLEALGLWETIHAHRTAPGPLELVDAEGRALVRIPEVMTAGDVELLRGDLTRLLVAASGASTTYRFGVRPTAIARSAAGADVTFDDGRAERFDLVVGADGLHSRVRSLALPSAWRLVDHGYELATFALPNLLERGPRLQRHGAASYAEPGRSVTVSVVGPAARVRCSWRVASQA